MMHANTLSAFSLASQHTHDLVNVPADAAGQCQRAGRVCWAPLCALAFVVLSSPPVGLGEGRARRELSEEVVVAACVVRRGSGSDMQADSEHGRTSATPHGELVCLVSARDAVLVLERSCHGTELPTHQVENRQTGMGDSSVYSWAPTCLFLGADGKSLAWLPLEGVREAGAARASADGGEDVAGDQAAGQGFAAWSGEEVWRVSVDALRKSCESITQPGSQVGTRLPLPPGVVLSRIWSRPLPPRLPRAEREKAVVGADLTHVAGWDVHGNRVVVLCCARQRLGAKSGSESGSGEGRRYLTSCHSIITLEANEAVVEVAWRGCVDVVGGGSDGIAVLTTQRVVVVEGRECVTAGAGDRWRVVGEVAECFIESVMWVGGALCFSSSSCLRVLYLPSASARCGTPAAEWSLETLCTLDTCGGKLATCLPDRIVYVAQEHGVPFIVSRPIGLLNLLLRGGGLLAQARNGDAAPTRVGENCESDLGEVARRGRGCGVSTAAAHVLERFDCRRSSPELLAALCDAGEKPLAWALSQRMPWLPLHHLLGLAFQCGKHKYCIGLMDAMARSGASPLRVLAQHYREVGQACIECEARATAAQAFVRAALCGWEECFWTLYDMFDTHSDEKGLAALLAIASKCSLSYLRVACAARLNVAINSDDLLPDGVCRAGVGVGGGVGGWWERWGGLLPWEALLGSASGEDHERTGEAGAQGIKEWHSLQDIEQTGEKDRSAVAPGEIAVEHVKFATRTEGGKVWVGSSGIRDGKEDLPGIDLNVYENWLSWRSSAPADSRRAGELSHVQQGQRDGGHDIDAFRRSKGQNESGPGNISGNRSSSAAVDAEGYSIRPSDVENVGRRNNNPFAPTPISHWSGSDEEEEDGEVLKPVIRVTIKSVDEIKEEDNKEELLNVMKQMMSAPGDKAPEAGGQPAGVLDIGLGSTSLFAGKSRRRTVEMPPSSVVKQDSETEGKHGLALVSSEEHSTVRQDVSGSGLPSQQETNLSDPAANQTADPFAADPFETAPSLAFSEGLSLGFGPSADAVDGFKSDSSFPQNSMDFMADPFAGTVPDGDAVFGTDPFASFPSALPPAALNGDAGDTQEMHLKAFGDGDEDVAPDASDNDVPSSDDAGGDFGSDPFASGDVGPGADGDARGDEDAEPRSADPFAGTVPDGDAVFGTDPFASFPSALPPAALNGDAGDTQEMHLKAFGDGDEDVAPDASDNDVPSSDGYAAEAGGDFGSDPFAASTSDPSADGDARGDEDAEPQMADAMDRNIVALEQDASSWAAEVSDGRACVSEILFMAHSEISACR